LKKKKWPRILLALLVAAAAAAYFVPKYLQPQEQTALLSGMAQHTVGRGDVSVTVTGSGKLEMADTLEIALPTGIEVQDVFVETGDYCAEGEILASLDVDSLSERAAALSAELSALDMQLMARRTVSEIASPVKGRIVQIFADENDDVTKIRCVRMELGEPDASGRRRPLVVPDSAFDLEVDCVIMSLGTSPNPLIKATTAGLFCNEKGGIVVNEDGLTSKTNVYAGGDAVTGAATVILAMGAGKTAAKAIDEALSK